MQTARHPRHTIPTSTIRSRRRRVGANTYATSTNYIWNGDTLLATIDQTIYNGTATGTPITRYIHPDHLGSTNVVTDASGTVAQLLDYYPYGATRVSTNTYPTNEKRQYIGQFSDAQSSGSNFFKSAGYRLFNLMRASLVVKRQSALAWAVLRFANQALTSALRAA